MTMSLFRANQTASEVVDIALSIVPAGTLPPVLLYVDFVNGVYRPSIWYRGENNTINMAFPKPASIDAIIALCDAQLNQGQINGWAEITISIESRQSFVIEYKPPDTPEVELDLLPEGRSEQVAREYFGNGPIQFVGTP
jgi:hypothetical protein